MSDRGGPVASLLQPGDSAARTLKGVALGERPGRFDVALQADRIAAITPSPSHEPAEWVALPAFVNFHAHAGRSFVAPARRPTSLADAVAASRSQRAEATVDDIRTRALRFFERSVVHGTARVRTHTDVDPATGMRSIEGSRLAADEMHGEIDVEMVAFANAAADPARAATRDLLGQAVRLGATLIGAVPAMYEHPLASAHALLALALDLDVAVDIHLDEHLDAAASVLEQVVDAILERELEGRVTISHACVLGVLDAGAVARILDKMARARVALSVQPALNLYLQDRGATTPRQRGLPPVREALRAGVAVRFGTDNVRDWFFPYGDADPLDEGHIGALACQLDAPADLMAVMCDGRSALRQGDVADLVLIRGESFDDVLARRPAGRLLVRRGRLMVPRTS